MLHLALQLALKFETGFKGCFMDTPDQMKIKSLIFFFLRKNVCGSPPSSRDRALLT